MSKNKVVGIFILCGAVLIVLAVFLGTQFRSMKPVTNQDLDALAIDAIDKVMIVAHPDDETIWGGAHLASERYLVVCITNGKNKKRTEEFISAVTKNGSIPLILDYPDKELNIRSRWFGYEDDIKRDISTVLAYKDWSQIVTHNPDGEYGHIHHKKVSRFVTQELRTLEPDGSGILTDGVLWYFGKYYTKEELDGAGMQDQLVKAEDSLLARKEEMLNEYVSQTKVIRKTFDHMLPYEMWQKGY